MEESLHFVFEMNKLLSFSFDVVVVVVVVIFLYYSN
jgi:hypothetical protein